MDFKRLKLEENLKNEFKLPLRNKNKEIIAWTLLDEDDFEKFKDAKFNFGSSGYVRKGSDVLHRTLLSAKKGDVVDHINNNKLDNRKQNLRISTHQENARNKSKLIGKTSMYYGVSWVLRDKRWNCSIRLNNKTVHFNFKQEIHAAYYHDVLVEKYNLAGSKRNGIEKPIDFIEPIKKKQISKYGVGIQKTSSNKYVAMIDFNKTRYKIGTFDTEQEAQQAYYNKKKELEEDYETNLLNTPITRNKDGMAIIILKNKNKQKVAEAIVDDDTYYKVVRQTWCLDSTGYPASRKNSKQIRLHQFLMNSNSNELINHINKNKLDNRIENLEFSNRTFNGHNKTKRKNASSSYFGVTKINNRYQVVISKDRKQYKIGRFENEIDAAKAYDAKAKELYGECANLNFKL